MSCRLLYIIFEKSQISKKCFMIFATWFFGLTSRSDAQRKTTTKNILALEFLLHWLTTVIFQSFSYYFVSFFVLLTTFVRGSIKSCVLFALHTRLKVQFLSKWKIFISNGRFFNMVIFNFGRFFKMGNVSK